MAEWSYAFRRMRILFWVAAAIRCPSSVFCRLEASYCLFARQRRTPSLRGPPHPPLRDAGAAEAQRGRIGLLLDDLGDDARADGTATLADGEPEALVHGDRLDQLDLHLHVVARHDHLDALGQVSAARDVGRAEVELRAVAREERRVAAALLLLQHVHLGLELRVRGDRPRLAQHLPALDLLALRTAQEAADVVAGLALIEDLAEHLDAGHDGGGRRADADDLHVVARVDDALLDAAGRDGPAAGDREDVLDRHQERTVERALRLGDVRVELLGEIEDPLGVLGVALEGA